MNFERLAPFYPWMECLLAGGLMQRCRTAFLSRIKNCQCVLLVGEGTGRFLVELLRCNPKLKIVCVEQSEKMIRQIQRRLAKNQLDVSRVQFKQIDILDWTPAPDMKFDLVVTNFFLDCFRAEQLQKLVPLLSKSTTTGAIWLLADFRLPQTGWRHARAAVILSLLYAFFKFTTALSASRITPPDDFLRSAGFNLVNRQLASFGLVYSDLWQKI